VFCVYSLFCSRQGRKSRVEARLNKRLLVDKDRVGGLGCVVVAPMRAGDLLGVGGTLGR
jgi:hypothetical protein